MKQASLTVAAMLAFAWCVVRAATQAVTIDEAATFHLFAHSPWVASSNNHVMNSLLMGLSVNVFGVSEFAIRLPALLGALLYLIAAWRFCVRLAGLAVPLLVFVCLAFNPLVGDFLVAARGYGLALAFLLHAILFLLDRRTVWASLCLALALAANFSFGFVIAATGVWLVIREPKRWVRAIVPGAIVTLLLDGWTLAHFPRAELFYGAQSWAETFASLQQAMLYRVNPAVVNPWVQAALESMSVVLLPLAALAIAACALYYRQRVELSILLGAALAVHYAAHLGFGLLLPKDRTGLYIPVFLTLAAGAMASIPPLTRVGHALRGALVASLGLCALYFVSCMRLDHFKEWDFDAESDRVYETLACLHREHGVKHVASAWFWEATSNFYRVKSGREALEIVDLSKATPNTQVFVLNHLFDKPVMEERGLQEIERGHSTAYLIAAAPQLAASAAATCLRP